MSRQTIGVLHPGQMGIAVAATAKNSGNAVYWASERRGPETRRRAESGGLLDAGSAAKLCESCGVLISVCPPEFAEEVAQEAMRHQFRGLYIDANAISPERVQRMGEKLVRNGIRFVDACIIGLPATARGQTWLWFSGGEAVEAASYFSGGPLETEILRGGVGQASALKMCYAAQTKGIAALRGAVLGAAQNLGVLEALERQCSRSGEWPRMLASMRQVTPKAWRFVAEMHEIAATFEAAGMPPEFHQAAAEIYSRLAAFKGSGEARFEEVVDALSAPQHTTHE